MDGLLSLLLFAVLFFVMMRFGCGAHIMHGHGGHANESGAKGDAGATDDAKDPVCGMDVAAGKGYAMNWGGRAYRFCSRQCLDRFEAEPAKFAAGHEGKA